MHTERSIDTRMGGLLIADAARDVARNTRSEDPLWPHIVGVIGEILFWSSQVLILAFDTPVRACADCFGFS